MLRSVLVISAALAAFTVATYAQHETPVTANILQRVFFIKFGSEYGTAFTVDVEGRQYLVSAKHLLEELKDEDKLEIFYKGEWKTLKVTRIRSDESKVDIVTMGLHQQLSPTLPIEPSSKNLRLSQDVYFLGFPYGLRDEVSAGINRGFPIPFVKRAIVSAIGSFVDGEKVFYLDGINNPGFSGGPVVFFDYAERKPKIAAVISGYRSEPVEVYQGEKPTQLNTKRNTGIIVAYPIESVVELSGKNPLGFDLGSDSKND